MKRKMLAAAMAALLLTLMVSCSPRPEEEAAYGFPEPVTLELSGRDADRFEMKYLGLYVDGVGAADPALRFDIRSLDGNCCTFGVSRYRNGEPVPALDYQLAEDGVLVGTDSGQGYIFYGQVFREGESEAFDNVYGAGSSDSFILPKESDESGIKLLKFPYCEPGRYTVTFYAREYVPNENSDGAGGSGSSGDGFYEFGFEFEVPELPDKPLEKMLVSMWEANTGEGEPVALLCALLYAPDGIRYMQEDTMRFERFDPESRKYVPAVDICAEDDRWRFAGGTVRYMFPNGRTPVPWSEAAERETENANGEGALLFVETPPVFLRGWNTTDLYRFSVDFAEQPDGSGKAYTCSIPLDFSGYDGELPADFGYADETIYIGSGGSPTLPDGLGDSHVEVKSFGYDYGIIGGAEGALKVVVESDIPLYVTNGELVRGERVPNEVCRFTQINADGSETDCGFGWSYTALPDSRDAPYLTPGKEETLLFGFRFAPEAGEEYRITVFLRDVGEALHTLSIRFRVPVRSSRLFDLLSVYTEELSGEEGTISVQPLIRSNFKKEMYAFDAKLELLTDGQWTEVPNGCENLQVDDIEYVDFYSNRWQWSNELKCVFVNCRFPDRSADYRLTVSFTDRWYGGETYTLTLKLRFDG